jgi:LysM repeat protein
MVGKSARLLAPIALVSVALGVYLIVHSSLATHTTPTAAPSSTAVVDHHHDGRHTPPEPTFYLVRPGDTLSAIAAKTGVPLSQLTALNPSVSSPPYSLQAGQRLRLRR